MNVAILEKAKHSILADPEFSMADWGHCIGQHVCRAARGSSEPVIPKQTVPGYQLSYLGEEVIEGLGVNHTTMNKLCYYGYWPRQFMYERAHNKEQAIRRIDHFIATDGTDELKADLPEAYGVHESALEPEQELVSA